jgi:hypothetical protein
LTSMVSRGVKKAWRERRVAAETGEPAVGWFQRAVDWMDGRVVEADETSTRDASDDSIDPFVTLDARPDGKSAYASWESQTEISSDAKLSAKTADDEEEPVKTHATASAKKEKENTEETKIDPLADRTREPTFVFTMGGDEGEASDERDDRDDREKNTDSTDSLENNREKNTREPKAYQREKRSKPFGDAVSDLPQRSFSERAAARARAEREKVSRGLGGGNGVPSEVTTSDVPTDIAVLTPANFDRDLRFAKRLSDGVGLGVAGGLAGNVTGNDKKKHPTLSNTHPKTPRRWLVAFCTRWSRECNLLVREFALLGGDKSLHDFGLGWVDCTPPKMTSFCGVRFGQIVMGYPTVVLITGGRAVRYSAVDKERIAGAMAPWARRVALEIDGGAPNRERAQIGVPVPEPDSGSRVSPVDGVKGTRAYDESEFDALRDARERKMREHERVETRAVAEGRRKRLAKEKERGTQKAEPSTATTAPKKSKRRVAREAAEARRRQEKIDL